MAGSGRPRDLPVVAQTSDEVRRPVGHRVGALSPIAARFRTTRISEVAEGPGLEHALGAIGHVEARRPVARGDGADGGDDYEILCTVAPERLEAFRTEAAAAGIAVAAIGTVTPGDGPPRFDMPDGAERVFKAGAFSHF
jgi:thiamine-monophosphate kinase